MPSETDFLNGALGMAGCSRITSIEDRSVEAGWCRTFYPALRRSTLRMASWKFAGARVQLPQEASGPAFGYAYAFTMPASMLKLRNYNGMNVNIVFQDDPTVWWYEGGAWRIEGRSLFSNDQVALLEYVQDVTNPDVWDSLYYEMLAAWLGAKLALAIRKDHQQSQGLLQIAMGTWMPLALAVDGQEKSVETYQSNELIWGRNP